MQDYQFSCLKYSSLPLLNFPLIQASKRRHNYLAILIIACPKRANNLQSTSPSTPIEFRDHLLGIRLFYHLVQSQRNFP